MSFDGRLFERGEVDPVVPFVDADERLFHPERDAARTRESPASLSDLVFECAVQAIAVEMHVAIALGGPEKMLTVIEEVEIVGHVHPTGIRLGEYASGAAGLAIG